MVMARSKGTIQSVDAQRGSHPSWQERIALEERGSVRSMGKAIKLGMINELPTLQNANYSPHFAHQKAYNLDPTFHNVDLRKEKAGLARNFFGVGSVHVNPEPESLRSGLGNVLAQYKLTPYGLYPNEGDKELPMNQKGSARFAHHLMSQPRISLKCYDESEKKAYMSSSIDLSQPDYGRAKVTSRKVLKDDSDAMNDFIQSSRPPRGIHIPDPRYPRTSIPNSVPESIHKNPEIWKSPKWDLYLEQKEQKKAANAQVKRLKQQGKVKQSVNLKQKIRENKMKELADRKYLQNSQKSLSPEDMHREYRIAPRMEDILRQNAAKIKMKAHSSKRFAVPQFEAEGEHAKEIGKEVYRGKYSPKKKQSAIAASAEQIILPDTKRNLLESYL